MTGSHGLIGSALLPRLRADGHRVVRLVRGAPEGSDDVQWDPDAEYHRRRRARGRRRGRAPRRRRHRRQEVDARTQAADPREPHPGHRAPGPHPGRPPAPAGGAGLGLGGRVLRRTGGPTSSPRRRPPGDDFPAQVCVAWEAATAPAAEAGIRVATIRTGIVLAAHGGALHRMLLPFRLGLGGRIGSGEQYMSWITLDDHVAAIRHVIGTDSVAGPVNLTAPNPATNAEFTRALGAAVHRPTLLPTPLFPLKAVYGGELVRAPSRRRSARRPPRARDDRLRLRARRDRRARCERCSQLRLRRESRRSRNPRMG